MTRFLTFLSIMFLAAFTFIAPVKAYTTPSGSPPPIPDSACDSEYYDELEARAWLEAQREITQNQNLIFKPDSVLEYSCFFEQIGDAVSGSTFSQPGQINNSVNNVVINPATDYLNANFSHDFLGGRASGLSVDTSSCNVMNLVWEAAKCMNFMANPAEDGFFSFETYAGSDDKRFLPTRCSAISSRWNTNITEASAAPDDDIEMFLDLFAPTACADPIPTGVMISQPKRTPDLYEEHYCPSPGCYYDPAADTCTGL